MRDIDDQPPRKSSDRTRAELTAAAQGFPLYGRYIEVRLKVSPLPRAYEIRTRSNPRQPPHCHAQPQQSGEPAPVVKPSAQVLPHDA